MTGHPNKASAIFNQLVSDRICDSVSSWIRERNVSRANDVIALWLYCKATTLFRSNDANIRKKKIFAIEQT